MKEILLKVTIDEANLMLEGLGNLPFVKVYALIGKIQEQAGQQVQGAGVAPVGAGVESTPPVSVSAMKE
jgi:hypothetical protein